MGRRWREGDSKKALNSAFLWKSRNKKTPIRVLNNWLRGPDLNRRPSGYEPDELPGCSTPRHRTAFTSSNFDWLRGPDLNRRPSGYEPDELPGCSTPRHRTAFTSSNFDWLRGPDLNRRPSGYEPDELPGCSTPRPWMRTILRSRFHATFFLPGSRNWDVFEQKQTTKAYFCAKFASGSGYAFH